MIKSSTYMLSLATASALTGMGKTAVPQNNTVLQELVRLSLPSQDMVIDSDQSLESFGHLLEGSTTGTLELPTDHDNYLDGLIHDLSKLVNQHINTAKNIVKPVVIDFAEKLQHFSQDFDKRSAENSLGQYEIVEKCVPDILRDESFIDTLVRYDGKSLLTPDDNARLRCAVKTKEELAELISTGTARFDKLLAGWLAEMPSEFLVQVWNSFFTTCSTHYTLTYTTVSGLNVYDRIDASLAIYLMANKIYDDVQEQTDAVDLNTYRDYVSQIREFAAVQLTFSLKKANLNNIGKIIVIDSNDRRIIVNSDVYRDWIANRNGKPEIILGSFISQNTFSGVPALSEASLTEKSDQFLKTYESYRTYYIVSENNHKFEATKGFINTEVLQGLAQQVDIEKAYALKNPNYVESINQLLLEQLSLLKKSDLDDPHALSRIFIGKVRFYYTSAYEIFETMVEAAKANPDIDPREAALLAAINYLADYISDQISTGK